MKYCRPEARGDYFHERELDWLRAMSAHNDIGVAAGIYHCANFEICPPLWLTKAAAKLLIELLKREKSQNRGRTAGRIARYRQDLWDFARWCAVIDIRELRERTKQDLKEWVECAAREKLTQDEEEHFHRLKRTSAWLRHDTFECASMTLRGSDAYAGAVAVKRSYRRVQAAYSAHAPARYHLMYGDFVFKIGLDWPGSYKPGTKWVPFYELTP